MALRLALAAAVLLALAPIAFWPQYLSRLGEADGYTHAHALPGTAWLLLLVGQPLLVHRRAVGMHRALGRIAVPLGAAFFVTGILTAHRGLSRLTPEQLGTDGYIVYLPLSMTLIFGVALALGVTWRSSRPVHARFMAATALPLLDPLLARILGFYGPTLPAEFLYQVPAFSLAVGALVGLSATLPPGVRGGRGFQLFAVGTAVVLVAWFAAPYSGGWATFARWFQALPIT